MVKNLPCNARDTGLITGLGRSHMRQSNYVCHNYWARALPLPKAKLLEPVLLQSHSVEKPVHDNEEQPPLTTAREILYKAMKIHYSQKINES